MPPRKRNAATAAAEAAGPRDIIEIEVIDGPAKGAVYTKQLDKLQIGRTRTSQIHIKGDPAVSQKHAVISWNGKRWEIVDVGSSNGTVLNGVELDEEGEPMPLADGDTLMIGTDTTTRVKIIKAETPQDESPPKAAKTTAKATAKAAKGAVAVKEEDEEAATKENAKPAKNAKATAPKAVAEKEAAVEEPSSLEANGENMTVEQYLSATCDALADSVREDVDAVISDLKTNLAGTKAELIVACK